MLKFTIKIIGVGSKWIQNKNKVGVGSAKPFPKLFQASSNPLKTDIPVVKDAMELFPEPWKIKTKLKPPGGLPTLAGGKNNIGTNLY